MTVPTGTPNRTFAALACVILAAGTVSAASQDSPTFAGPGNRDCAECPELVVVPAGEFQMGSPDSEAGRLSNEGPAHTVKFAKPFAIGKYEITFDEWDACVAAFLLSHGSSPALRCSHGRGGALTAGLTEDGGDDAVRYQP